MSNATDNTTYALIIGKTSFNKPLYLTDSENHAPLSVTKAHADEFLALGSKLGLPNVGCVPYATVANKGGA